MWDSLAHITLLPLHYDWQCIIQVSYDSLAPFPLGMLYDVVLVYPCCCRSPGDCWRRHSFGSASQRWWEKVAICWSSCCRKTYQRLLQVCAWLAVIWYPSCAFSFCDFITLSFLFFFFFSKDWFLRYVYRAASAQLSIAGLQAIKWKNRRMTNVDLSELVRPRFTWVFLRWNCWLL